MSSNPELSSRPRTLFISNVAWDYLWQRHQALASQFARDFDVVYCEIPGIRRVRWNDFPRIARRVRHLLFGLSKRNPTEPVPDNVVIARPLTLPATNRLFEWLNRRLLARFLRKNSEWFRGFDILVTYTPSRSALFTISKVPHERLVYDCTDNFSAVRGIPNFFVEDEIALLECADLTIVPTQGLADQHQRHAKRIEVVPHGAELERFKVVPAPAGSRTNTPSLIYYGHMHAQHFDFRLVESIAKNRPGWRITLIGPIITPWHFPTNVELLGAQRHERLRDYLQSADVIILPYKLNNYTRAVLPAKTYECLASGLPVVATPLPELQRNLGSLFAYAETPEQFISAIETELSGKFGEGRVERLAAATNESWNSRYRKIRSLLLETCE